MSNNQRDLSSNIDLSRENQQNYKGEEDPLKRIRVVAYSEKDNINENEDSTNLNFNDSNTTTQTTIATSSGQSSSNSSSNFLPKFINNLFSKTEKPKHTFYQRMEYSLFMKRQESPYMTNIAIWSCFLVSCVQSTIHRMNGKTGYGAFIMLGTMTLLVLAYGRTLIPQMNWIPLNQDKMNQILNSQNSSLIQIKPQNSIDNPLNVQNQNIHPSNVNNSKCDNV